MPKPKIGKYHIEDAGNGQYFVSLETVPQDFLALAVKRVLDIAGAILGVMLCALVFPFYALWLRIVSPGSVFFRQERIGRNGRFFTMYKFRTMRPDAERELPELMALNQMNWGIVQDQKRSTNHRRRKFHAPDASRRTSAVLERVDGRHESGRDTTADPQLKWSPIETIIIAVLACVPESPEYGR